MKERSIFLAALEQDPQERSRFVEEACGDDHQLRERIETLLKAHASDRSILDTPAAARLAVPSLEAIPGYTILAEIHRGGQGVVYQAIQQSTGQEVALKVMLEGPFISATAQRRFDLEIELAGKLRHRNIAKIFDRGVADGHSYYVMEYIRGRWLTHYVRDHELSIDDTLRLFKKVCDVADYAHQQGVIHRDLKPSNILVDDQGEPYILDFGLAKTGVTAALGDSHAFADSRPGQVVGTPAYMSPEQAAGESERIDLRSDVYSLGVLLYELLTGRLPCDVSGRIGQALQHIQLSEPARPRSINRKLSDEIETIVLKALFKERERRYATAGTLGEDVGRYLAGQPIEAKRDSAVYLLRKTLRRHKATAAAAALFAVVIAVAFVVSFTFWRQAVADRAVAERRSIQALAAKEDADRARELAEDAKQTADARADDLRRRLHGYYIRRAAATLAATGVNDADPIGLGARATAARGLLADCPVDLRRWEWNWLHSNLMATPATLFPGQGRPYFTPDGSELVVAASLNSDAINVWNLRSGETVRTLSGKIAAEIQIALSPHGEQVAAIDTQGKLVLWDLASASQRWAVQAHSELRSEIAFSPSGTQIATACRDGTLCLWDANTGDKLRTIGPLGYPLRCVAFSPDSRQVAVAAHGYRGQPETVGAAGRSGGPATVFDVATGERVSRWPPQGGTVHCVAYHPDGTRIVTGSADHRVQIWDQETGRELQALTGHADLVYAVAYNPAGDQVASASGDGTIRLWDCATGKELAKVDSLDDVRELCFHPGGSQLAFYDVTRGIGIWNIGGYKNDSAQANIATTPGLYQHNAMVLRGHKGTIRALEFSPDGSQIASASFDKTVRLWDVETGQELRVLRGHTKWALSLAFSKDGQQLLSGEHVTDDAAYADIKLWEVESGRQLRTYRAHSGGVWWLAFNSRGDRFASAGSESIARVWELASDRPLFELPQHLGAVEGIAFRQDDSQLITLDTGDNQLKIWDARDGRKLGEFDTPLDGGRCLAVSRDGSLVATGGGHGIARIWDAKSGKLLHDLRGHGLYVTSVAFGADGHRLFTASLDKTVRVWNIRTGEELLSLQGHAKGLWCVVVSPNGHRIASAGEDGSIVIWDARPVDDETLAARKRVEVARRAVEEQFAKLSLAGAVIESLQTDNVYDATTRDLAVEIATARGDDPYWLSEQSREICRHADGDEGLYAKAHQYAQNACDVIRDDPELLAVLGLAQYRIKAYNAALESLQRSDQTQTSQQSHPRPDVWCVKAMSHFRLGESAKARDALQQSQALLRESQWAESQFHRGLLLEAEQLLGQTPGLERPMTSADAVENVRGHD